MLQGQQLLDNNSDVSAFLADITKTLKAKGFTREKSLESSLYHYRFYNEARNFRIDIDGWHGTGKQGTSRFYGAAKTFQTLYAGRGHTQECIVRCAIERETLAELVELQDKAMAKAREYCNSL